MSQSYRFNAPTSVHNFYQQLQEIIDQTTKKDIMLYEGNEKLKLEKMRRQISDSRIRSIIANGS